MSWWVNVNRIVTKEYAEKENSKRNIEDDKITKLIEELSEIDPYDCYVRYDSDRERLIEIVDNAELMLDTEIKEGESILECSMDISLSYNCTYLIESLGVTIEEFQKLKGQDLFKFLDVSLSIVDKELYGGDLNNHEVQPYKDYEERLRNNEKFNPKRKILHTDCLEQVHNVLKELFDYLADVDNEDLEHLVVELS